MKKRGGGCIAQRENKRLTLCSNLCIPHFSEEKTFAELFENTATNSGHMLHKVNRTILVLASVT